MDSSNRGYLIGLNFGGRKYGRPKFRAALIVGARGPSAHIRAAHTFQSKFSTNFTTYKSNVSQIIGQVKQRILIIIDLKQTHNCELTMSI